MAAAQARTGEASLTPAPYCASHPAADALEYSQNASTAHRLLCPHSWVPANNHLSPGLLQQPTHCSPAAALASSSICFNTADRVLETKGRACESTAQSSQTLLLLPAVLIRRPTQEAGGRRRCPARCPCLSDLTSTPACTPLQPPPPTTLLRKVPDWFPSSY